MARHWAVQYQTFVDGDFDRLIVNDSRTGHPFTLEGAQRLLRREQQNRERFPDAKRSEFRIVYRDVPDWKVWDTDDGSEQEAE